MVNMSRPSNKVTIVTGASKGIGGGIATALGAAAACVAVNYSSDRQGAERVAHAIIDGGGEAIAVGADVERVLPEWFGARNILPLVYPTPRGMLPSVRSLIDYLLIHVPA
jgi:NAD(P)-dependent dehydrogenase (short-subunit alcohol dehydrogenase family)